MTTLAKAIEAYIIFRDRKKALADKHKEEMRPYNDKLDRIGNAILALLNQQETESAKTKAGTAFKSMKTDAKVTDWETFIEHVKENDLYHMLEKRVAKSSVEEYIEAQGSPPPGVDIVREIKINVRR